MKFRMLSILAVCAAGATEAHADTLYFGVHGGFASLSDNWTLSGLGTYNGASSASGVLGGLQVGWEHPFDNVAVGAEADLSFLNLNAGFDGFEGIGVDANLLSSLRLRAKLTNGPIMPFVTAGIGLGNFKYTELGTNFAGTGNSVDKGKIGVVVGAGFDANLASHWTGRLETLYYIFGNDSGVFSDNYLYTVNSNVFVVRAGLNYNF